MKKVVNKNKKIFQLIPLFLFGFLLAFFFNYLQSPKEKDKISTTLKKIHLDPRCNSVKDYKTKLKGGEKIAYLTFDDGPAIYTKKIVSLLNQYKIKGTFFFIGDQINKNPNVLEYVLKNGNMVGNHTLSHKYDNIYKNFNNYKQEVFDNYNKINSVAKKVIPGCLNLNHVFRFPGGSNNYNGSSNFHKKQQDYLDKNNIMWLDWNVYDSGIEHRYDYNYVKKSQIVLKQIDYDSKHNINKVVLLTHDFLEDEVKQTKIVIEGLIKRGYKFDYLNNQIQLAKQMQRW